jgi:hypothetical protein
VGPGASNQYSRNAGRGATNNVKTSYTQQKTQDLLQCVQQSSKLINNIKNGGGSFNTQGGAYNQSGGKSGGIQFRKSFGP